MGSFFLFLFSAGVDLRSSKVCELGFLNYKAKNVFYPFERTRFRCRYDYYWASVFKVRFLLVLAIATSPIYLFSILSHDFIYSLLLCTALVAKVTTYREYNHDVQTCTHSSTMEDYHCPKRHYSQGYFMPILILCTKK